VAGTAGDGDRTTTPATGEKFRFRFRFGGEMKVRLATRDGREVADVVIPPFQYLPEVLIWGERIFYFYAELTADGEPNAAEYREVFAFWIPPTAPFMEGK
jgi:hypothetical protein